ncbi:MAG: hypothetical protein ACRDT0_17330 [Pseudonocardiaceae bacterium]
MTTELDDRVTQLSPLCLDEGALRAARLVVCGHARDVDDATLLLEALGLLPAADPATTGEAHR